MASISRHRCAQQSCRRHVGYPWYALQRSVTNHPQTRSPKSARAKDFLGKILTH